MEERAQKLDKFPTSSIKLVDYSLEIDEETDFSGSSQEDPTFKPPSSLSSFSISNFSDYGDQIMPIKNLTRRRKRNPEEWKVNDTKSKRAKCISYTNKKKVCAPKTPKQVDCSHCRFQCSVNFTENDRIEICKTYWGINCYQRQKDFLIKYVKTMEPKRRTKNRFDIGARSLSKFYYLEKNGQQKRVCSKFFEKTLCISNGPVNTAVKNISATGCFEQLDYRGRKTPGNKTREEDLRFIKKHIQSFPVMESHYVRKSSKKLYLDKNLSILKMYDLYKEPCKKEGKTPVRECTYRKIFCDNYNFSFFKPKKDQCSTCSKYELADQEKKKEMELNYSEHIKRKVECRKEKAKDKERSSNDPSFLTVTFDLESVLQLPFSGVSLFYYSRKICVYNLTIYLANGEGHCYTWNELHGKRGSNEIGSILFKFLNSLPTTVTEISLFCDTCGGQNRNQQVAAILLYAIENITHLQKIELKFLESGHSQMECDSMHSAIESAKKNRTAFQMSDWVDIFKSARSTRSKGRNKIKKPYEVHLLSYNDFYDLQKLASLTIKNRTKDQDEHKVFWLKIKSFKFEKECIGILQYTRRYDHSFPYKKIAVYGRGRRRCSPVVLNFAYQSILPISIKKKSDLIKLAETRQLPEELVPWYMGLPTHTSEEAIRLPEPDQNESEHED